MPASGYISPQKQKWLIAMQKAFDLREFKNFAEWTAYFNDPENADLLPEGETLFLARSTFYDYRKHLRPLGKLDRAWSLGQLSSNEISITNESLPTIEMLWYRAIAGGKIMTIRQAIWIDRLRMTVDAPMGTEGWASSLFSKAAAYSQCERLEEIPATQDLDIGVVREVHSKFANQDSEYQQDSAGAAIVATAWLYRPVVSERHEISPVKPVNTRLEFTDDIGEDALEMTFWSDLNNGRKIWKMSPLWLSTAAMFGFRSVLSADSDWMSKARLVRRADQEMIERLKDVQTAVTTNDWNSYQTLTSIAKVRVHSEEVIR